MAFDLFNVTAQPLLLIWLVVPLLLLAGGWLLRTRVRPAIQLGLLGCVLVGGSAVLVLAGLLDGPSASTILADRLSAALMVLTAFIGAVILQYSRRYLAGQARQGVYVQQLLATLATVWLMVGSGHLLVMVLAWMANDGLVHRLLLFFDRRPAALLAARKRLLVAGLANVLLLGMVFWLYQHYGTLSLSALLDAVQHAAHPEVVLGPALLLVLAVILKTAQLPTHGWILQVMEAPTPVSALLHAGIINMGGYVLLRLSPLLDVAPAAQGLLVAVGTLTAVGAALVMLTRISVKVMLAWSTCAQMGLMLVEIGLGAYGLALLHLLAHALYKAHAFLSAGRTAAFITGVRNAPLSPQSLPAGTLFWMVLAGLALLLGGWLASDRDQQVMGLLGWVFVVGLWPWLQQGGGVASAGRRWGAVLVLCGSYTVLHAGFASLWPGAAHVRSGLVLLVPALGFALLFWIQVRLAAAPQGALARWLYPRAFAGFYLDESLTRLTLWLWRQPGLSQPAVSTPPFPCCGEGAFMNTPVPPSLSLPGPGPEAWQRATAAASRRLAPLWPLDQWIAVNPWWGFVDQPLPDATAWLNRLNGTCGTLSLDAYRQAFQQGKITPAALQTVLRRRGRTEPLQTFVDLDVPAAAGGDVLWTTWWSRRQPAANPSWAELIQHNMGQYCAAWFDRGQALWTPESDQGLYGFWRHSTAHDHGLALWAGVPGLADRVARLPEDGAGVMVQAGAFFGLAEADLEDYALALLLSLPGWASWCAYLAWQADRAGQEDPHLRELLAIRLAWEWVAAEVVATPEQLQQWRQQQNQPPAGPVETLWIWQEALELSWQQPVHQALQQPLPEASSARPLLDAVFCIDVRSERLRRALEQQAGLRTHGFAGFFGLPLQYQPATATQFRPQLPGLLQPALSAQAVPEPGLRKETVLQSVQQAQRWKTYRQSALGGFGLVESLGLGAAWSLLRDTLGQSSSTDRLEAGFRPQLQALSLADAVDLAARVLAGMGLPEPLAPLVLLVGHASHTANNPHAAGLNCGACGGQSGEVNARILAELLNRPEIRAQLRQRGRTIPEDTRFVAALHETVTDEVQLFDWPESVGPGVRQSLDGWLRAASAQVRRERAPLLGLAGKSDQALWRDCVRRTRDWSEVRPEWGLANNAGFIAASRQRTRHLNLQGRCFLHNYDHARDPGLHTLALILTAPMVVAHWINFQYYASTVDNRRWGSGDKTLHNVVGGNLGVFEGNGGDLRSGLSLQSLHDGHDWQHMPLRLSVWVEAPPADIDTILARHASVRQLVEHQWLHLFALGEGTGQLWQRRAQGSWVAVGTDFSDSMTSEA